MSDEMRSVIVAALRVHPDHVYRARRPLDLADFFPLASLDRPDLHYRPWTPQTQPRLNADSQSVDMFAEIRRGDILVHHPYDAFSTSVERSSSRPSTTPTCSRSSTRIYRTSGDSPIVPALVRAAEQGKQAVAMVEVKARFDEERNIRWARSLERAGVHVVYGLAGLKTHCQAGDGRPPRGGRHPPLRPHRHRQLPPLDGAAVHRPRAVHVPRGRDRRRLRPVQPPDRLRPPAGLPQAVGGAAGAAPADLVDEIWRCCLEHDPRPAGADGAEVQRPGRPRRHRRAVPGVAGGRADRPDHPRHLLSAAGRAGPVRRTSA